MYSFLFRNFILVNLYRVYWMWWNSILFECVLSRIGFIGFNKQPIRTNTHSFAHKNLWREVSQWDIFVTITSPWCLRCIFRKAIQFYCHLYARKHNENHAVSFERATTGLVHEQMSLHVLMQMQFPYEYMYIHAIIGHCKLSPVVCIVPKLKSDCVPHNTQY